MLGIQMAFLSGFLTKWQPVCRKPLQIRSLITFGIQLDSEFEWLVFGPQVFIERTKKHVEGIRFANNVSHFNLLYYIETVLPFVVL